MKKQKWRALVDTGAEVSVMSEKMYSRIRNKSGLKSTSYALQGAGGKPLNVLGVTTLSFKVGSKISAKNFMSFYMLLEILFLEQISYLLIKPESILIYKRFEWVMSI